MSTTENIQMRLQSVNEVSFSMDLSNIDENINPDDLQIGFANQITPDIENNTIGKKYNPIYLNALAVCFKCSTFSAI